MDVPFETIHFGDPPLMETPFWYYSKSCRINQHRSTLATLLLMITTYRNHQKSINHVRTSSSKLVPTHLCGKKSGSFWQNPGLLPLLMQHMQPDHNLLCLISLLQLHVTSVQLLHLNHSDLGVCWNHYGVGGSCPQSSLRCRREHNWSSKGKYGLQCLQLLVLVYTLWS